MLRRGAEGLAGSRPLPTSIRAVMGYYAETGTIDVGSIRLKRRTDRVTEAMVESAFDPVERRVAEAFGREDVSFSYDTKLVLPAQLTLGYCYRRCPDAEHDRAEDLTRLAIEALIDGDMRDALNDDEFEDFAVDFPTDEADRAEIARIAQSTLEERVESGFADVDDELQEIYDWAVEVSEAHQDEDEHFRELLAAAEADTGGTDARERIRSQYKRAPFDDPPDLLTEADRNLPYARTQYDRVGVIYDGMLRMFDEAGFPITEDFGRAIVLAIVGAQIWLDDVDDYRDDRREGQLTPVTAEYLLRDREAAAAREVVEVSETYLDRARTAARRVDSNLTGVAIEYIYRSGDPSVLPGHE